MAELNPNQRNYYYHFEAGRAGIHKSILAALYAVHRAPEFADGEFGLGLTASDRVPASELDTFPKQAQIAANVIRSLTRRLLAQGWQRSEVWDGTQRRYSDRFVGAIAEGYTPAADDPISAVLAPTNTLPLLEAYVNDIAATYDGSLLPQNLVYLDKPLLLLLERITRYYTGLTSQREALLEGVRIWRQLHTRTEAIQSLGRAETGDTDALDQALLTFVKNANRYYSGYPHQRESTLRIAQLWRGLRSREAAIASLEKDTPSELDFQIVDSALKDFVASIPELYERTGEQRHALMEGFRLWRQLDSRSASLAALGISADPFEGGLKPEAVMAIAQQLDEKLLDFVASVPLAFQSYESQRDGLLRMLQIWRGLDSREATLQSLFADLKEMQQQAEDPFQQKLSPNFRLWELIQSSTADRLNIDNTPNATEIERLRQLAQQILQPAHDALGPLKITSGFRSEALNQAVGGVPNSDHRLGYAVDLVPLATGTRTLAKWIHDNRSFDQLILEFGSLVNPNWIHVSINPRNRRQVLWATRQNGRTVYRPVTL
ncbi:MAG: D-Ala-D-Ala carboxypeptidase family metallohydrolase [Synechococcales bacterium]|nr:D-Ala-D-Ala carboxypeptidase family metallohydrolase [Synechococcales bacterium]